ncbi:MAG: hypothetical protein A3A97_01160 [Candidatus Terrybacteria bacterium RIFCSPLOWO2_01_FULL_40_23]|uniref:Uncharacterized protein n=1 Tax=Candidatus Terrybacteria bacterium RIFCSPLOWO2_01_FULL_40_23 TaxID=1802366 RepID=A0A1G2PWQ5_9BACT|nr:MAG: hypothetical protein A3A97_01160 [Candidatus Terrybacteria bacterium RIFCSPLOWO2_01_FULL_40_23]
MSSRVYDDMTKYTVWLFALYLPPIILSALGFFLVAILYALFYAFLSVLIWIKRNKKYKNSN